MYRRILRLCYNWCGRHGGRVMAEQAVAERRKWELGWVLKGFNGPVRRARRLKGFTQKTLADVLDVRLSVVAGLELLTRRPKASEREQVADFLGLDPQDVWPDWLEPRDQPIRVETYQRVDAETFPMLDPVVRKEVLALPAPDDVAAAETREFVRGKIDAVLKSLSYREREILKMRFGLNDDGRVYTLDECRVALQITRERVRQIEAKALRKLRLPARAKVLEPAVTELFGEVVCPCGAAVKVGRYCRDCGRPGCGKCLERFSEGGRYVYRCAGCVRLMARTGGRSRAAGPAGGW
jgi:transcriptional regulator with XRE-family HTH domain